MLVQDDQVACFLFVSTLENENKRHNISPRKHFMLNPPLLSWNSSNICLFKKYKNTAFDILKEQYYLKIV